MGDVYEVPFCVSVGATKLIGLYQLSNLSEGYTLFRYRRGSVNPYPFQEWHHPLVSRKSSIILVTPPVQAHGHWFAFGNVYEERSQSRRPSSVLIDFTSKSFQKSNYHVLTTAYAPRTEKLAVVTEDASGSEIATQEIVYVLK